ncbi:SGNH/GDSL hydrolase family protein [Paenibacillus sp. FA6]|uniref:SGNH/GDSL hydrolase family protein n=1 Tax=Paenibacillus sp. FA6 TaxID=3413029 RepID=UPI003F656B7F
MEIHREKRLQMRRGLPHFQRKMLDHEPIVAFLGGSITEGAGASDADVTSWRALTEKYLKERLGEDRATCINAGVGGTNSTFGAHRLQEHVLQKGAIDLLFVEFSVNDDTDRDESIRGMEGIVRQCQRLSPHTDICFLYTAADKNLSGAVPFNIAVHEEVASYYDIPSISFAAEIYDLIRTGHTRWEALSSDGIHPNDEGHALYADYVTAFLEGIEPGNDVAKNRTIPKLPPMIESNYAFATMRDAREVESFEGFQISQLEAEPLMNWRFDTEHLLTSAAEASLRFTVDGQSAGICILCGPDTGIFEYALDDGAFQPVNLFDDWCTMAYRPVILMFPIQKERKNITITIRNTSRKDDRSTGTGLRIMKLFLN